MGQRRQCPDSTGGWFARNAGSWYDPGTKKDVDLCTGGTTAYPDLALVSYAAGREFR